MQEQKRRFPRVDRRLLVNYDHFNLDHVQDDAGVARTLDMSVRGLLLQVPRPVEPGTTLRLALDLDGEIIEAFGEVTRCAEDDEGMYTTGVSLRYVPERFIDRVEAHFRETEGEE